MSALARRMGHRWPALGLALAGRVGALVLALAVLALALAFTRLSLMHFWHSIGPIYRNVSTGSRLDFTWFFYGISTAWHHTDPTHLLYDVPAEDRWMTAMGFGYDHADVYGYPPPFAMLWSPLAALPYLRALTLWTRINLAALGVGLAIAAWHASPRFGLARWLVLGSAGLWAGALYSNFYWGQPDTLTFALVALGLFGICREHPGRWGPILGGVAIGLGAVFKVTPFAVLAYLSARWLFTRSSERGHAAGLGALGGWITVAVTSIAAGADLGWSTLWTYVHVAIPAVERSAWAHGPAPWNQGLRGVLMIWERSQHALAHQSLAFAAAVCGAAVLLIVVRPMLDHRLEAAMAALLVLLPWPSLEDHHFTVAILPWILVGGYLLDRVASVRRAWLWPLAALFAGVSVILASPQGRQFHWPPSFLSRTTGVSVPAGHYDRVYMLGGASYGPVRFTLRLQYRGGATSSVAATWPDWWSPGNPLPPAISGVAEKSGSVQNSHVGIYAFSYPVRSGETLAALRLPASLPRQNGGQEDLHIVAVTLHKVSGGYTYVHLPFNAHGIAPSSRFGVQSADSFDGNGNAFWTPNWPQGAFDTLAGGSVVPFSLPSARAGANVLSAPATAAPVAASHGAVSRVLTILFARAPDFIAISVLFAVALLAGAGESPKTVP